jgi:Trypsin-co-occurring domain 1
MIAPDAPEIHTGVRRLAGYAPCDEGSAWMVRPLVSYAVDVDEETVVRFEIEPNEEWEDVSADQVHGTIRQAMGPVAEGAKAVLDKVREAAPDEVEVKFAIKVTGQANWLIAKAATEGNFEVTLTWKRPTTN